MNEKEQQKAKINAVVWLTGAAVAIVLIVSVTLSAAALVIASRVNANAHTIEENATHSATAELRNAARIEQIEERDRDALRSATYRICEREQRDRAEQHLRAGLSPPGLIARLVRQLGLPHHLVAQVTIAAVRKRLPIFDCKPNLHGLRAQPLDAADQRAYVRRYATGKLDPTP